MTLPDMTVMLETGESQSLRAFQGQKLLLLNISGSWCAPCIHTLSQLDDLLTLYTPEKLQILAIMTVDTPDRVAEFREDHALGYALAPDPENTISEMYDIEAVPTILIVTPDFVVRAVFVGTKSDDVLKEALEQWIDAP